jgi:hypothetical protein
MLSQCVNHKNKSWWLKYVIPFSMPILYLQGMAYRQGILSPYKISDGLYPVNIQQALTNSFYFYGKVYIYLICLGFGWLVLALPLEIWLQYDKNRGEESIIKKFQAHMVPIENFIHKYKKAFMGPGLLLLIGYAISGLVVLVLIPFFFGSYQSTKEANNLIVNHNVTISKNSLLKTDAQIIFFSGNVKKTVDGIMLENS